MFIDFGAGQVRLLGNRRYEIIYNMQLHVVDDIVSETSKMEARAGAGVATPEYAVDQALARLDLIDHILYHLTGFTTTGMRGMQCTGVELSSVESSPTHDILTWAVRLQTDTAKKVMIEVEPEVVVIPNSHFPPNPTYSQSQTQLRLQSIPFGEFALLLNCLAQVYFSVWLIFRVYVFLQTFLVVSLIPDR
ncbi:MAG TPA: hypothetical protein PLU85_08365 [Bacteroidia bacterium]|mgnify:CR=1 FL=1|nr:hypothetical protein [Bacteroidia bacterium]QQR95280.1 MAG: hypothetical protein IPJ93_00345 [Bacteroidota bacterium]MBP7715399.1 hypothetical protein [Bacteroidia bacterium]MBP8669599.1 hypothetical protein [Bacteroidia bacterium]HOZ82468.1 hypothetical protein [Bacteroidia bacterium]